MRWLLREQSCWTFLSLLIISLLTALSSEAFYSSANLLNIARNGSFTAILALGSMVVLIGRGIDVSVGSIVGLSGIICAHLLTTGDALEYALAAALAGALVAGFCNGILIAYVKLSPLVVTIATLALYRSLALILSRGGVYAEFGVHAEKFFSLGGGELLGLPTVSVVTVIIALLLALTLHFCVWGIHLRAVGCDEGAAHANGVNVRRIKCSSYVVGAFLAGISGILTVSWLGGVTSDLGAGYELTAIAAAVIGGTSLSGARASVFGTLCGAFLFEVIRNSLILLGADALWQGFFVGVFILVALLIDRLRTAS